jgi:hypothetical protein
MIANIVANTQCSGEIIGYQFFCVLGTSANENFNALRGCVCRWQ